MEFFFETCGIKLCDNFGFLEVALYPNKIEYDHCDTNQDTLYFDQCQEEKACSRAIASRAGKITKSSVKLSTSTILTLFLYS